MAAWAQALLQSTEPRASARALLGAAAACSALFGAAIGGYTGRLQILYGAVKMPVFFLATLGCSFAAMHVLASSRLQARQTFEAALETIAVTAVVLGSLAPIVGLMSLSCPKPSASAYNFLILLLTACVATGGIAGVLRLHSRLRSARLTAVWVVIYQFVGAQMAWLLKPWVSHTFTDDRFIPLEENLKGNFYESIFRLLHGLVF
jgi:hypothetical protein